MSSIKIYDSKDFPTYLPKLNLLYDDLFSGGKGFRAKLIQLVGESLELPPRVELLLAQTIEFVHNASLLHDDLVDRSQLRRGKTAGWLKYTPEYAVLAGDYLLARVMVNLSEFGNIELVHYTAQIISDLLEGEWLQDSLVGDHNVKLAELDRVHFLKTASLFRWCLRAPFIAMKIGTPELHRHLEEMGQLLGLLFQRSDDLLDFDVRNFEKKAVLGDLKSGYFNSFASFALDSAGVETRKSLQKCQSLEEFKAALGGEAAFQEKLQAFDEINQLKIRQYRHVFEVAQSTLASLSQKKLAPQMLELPDVLYWRKRT